MWKENLNDYNSCQIDLYLVTCSKSYEDACEIDIFS